jgi:5-methylcytosine-specific restriction endonuclease McrA
MPYKNRASLAARASQLATNRKIQSVAKQQMLDLLGPFCNLCGETDPVVLQFDHKAPMRYPRNQRRPGPGSLMAAFRAGKESLFNVQVLCANCHARKTNMEHHQMGPQSESTADKYGRDLPKIWVMRAKLRGDKVQWTAVKSDDGEDNGA